MKKSIKFFVIIMFTIFWGLNCVKAISDTLGPIKIVGPNVVDECDATHCYAMPLKTDGSSAVICTEYRQETPTDLTCTLTDDWDEKVRYGVAAAVNIAKADISSTAMTNAYFAAELALNRFLYDKVGKGDKIEPSVMSNPIETLYDTYLSAAENAYNNYDSDSSVNITLSTTSLTFSFNGSNYESNSVTVSGVDSYNVTTNVGSVSKSGNSFKVEVPTSLLNSDITVTATVTATKTLDQARNYNCGEGYQTLTPLTLDSVTKEANKELSGTITLNQKVIIHKVDSENKPLSGAKLQVQDETGKTLYEWESTDTPYVIEGLSTGTYYLIETQAPKGYVLNTNRKEFVVSTLNETIEVLLENELEKNELEVEVPDTLSSKSAFLLTIAMLDIALGIGIITYVKKNKIKE